MPKITSLRMQKRYAVFFVLCFITVKLNAQSDNYVRGYQRGFQKGYCYNNYGCNAPIPPLTPIPGINEEVNSYEDGYQRGFVEGKNTRDQNPGSSIASPYSLSDFGEYYKPINTTLIAQILESKQSRYERQRQIRFENSQEKIRYQQEYQKLLNEDIEYYFDLFEKSLESVKDFSSLFSFVGEFENDVRKVIRMYRDCCSDYLELSISQKKTIIAKMIASNERIKKNLEFVKSEVQKYIDRPNEVIHGYYGVYGIIDYAFNEESGEYHLSKKKASAGEGDSYLYFERDKVIFKRPGEKPKHAFLKYDYFDEEAQSYILRDGWGQLLVINPSSNWVKYYHSNNGERFMEKTEYMVQIIKP